ncbi:Decaprenyl diphosphate synthase-like family-containing protein [Strongyloides ratti]|uniref:Decaprenyl diphosphate synthase-like family-containing protein n=1 Tax=Strongyloides ratti TaxID=34506 RepID=A0A090MQL3_STRRB|nr:Decaprenyl diphosphate synthase-like family-containing protein [Strongyloides ratti]CEF60463.1 Decaprenyl diphosphate synthase-like family-containing protein [Strongyloides ratti]
MKDDSEKIIKINEKISSPESVGLLFTDKNQISVSLVGSFIFWCMKRDIHRVTVYDPWNLISNYEHELVLESQKILCNYNSTRNIKTNEYIKLYVLGPSTCYNVLSKVTKQICMEHENIGKNSINERLMKEYIYEVDLLVRVGDIPSLCGYPCWANKHYVTEIEFDNLLATFTSRDRRKGK